MARDSDSGCEEHTDSSVYSLDTTSVCKPTHPCTFEHCNMVFSRPWRLVAHLRVHKGERPFKCTFENCSSEYTNNSHLRRHIKTAHLSSQGEVVRCNFSTCIQEFSNSWSLKRHIRVKHEKNFQFTCSTCNKGFKKRHQLKEHMYNHTGIPTFICHICQIGLVNGYQLRRHLSRHKNYACPAAECTETFQTWSALRKHSSIEHKPKEFKCERCDKSFTLQHNYQDHLNTHLEPADRSQFVCPYKAQGCAKSYIHKRNLIQHIKSFHDQISFICSLCKENFTTKQKMAEHILKQHCEVSTVPKVVPVTDEKIKCRKKRKTSGKPRRSMASKLLGIHFPPEVEKRLLEDMDCTYVYTSDGQNLIDVSNSEQHRKDLGKSDRLSDQASSSKEEPENTEPSVQTSARFKAVEDDQTCETNPTKYMELSDNSKMDLESPPASSDECIANHHKFPGSMGFN